MRQLVPLLAAIVPFSAHAATVMDDLDIQFALCLQPRLEVSNSSNVNGGDYDIAGSTDGQADAVDFYLRRFRPGFRGTYQNVWAFKAILNLDNTDRDSSSNTSRANKVQVHQASVIRTFADFGVNHEVQAGLDYPFFNLAQSQNTQALLINQRATNAFLGVRGSGVGYRVKYGMFKWGADVQNVAGEDSQTIMNSQSSEGLLVTTRLEVTGPGDWSIDRWTESFVGAPGHGITLGVEIGANQDDRTPVNSTVNNADRTQTVFGTDVLFHWDNLSALAEARWSSIETERDNGVPVDDVKGFIWLVQAGWAIPAAGVVFEPVARYSVIDLNTDDDNETTPFSTPVVIGTTPVPSNDYGTSGDQIEIGVNCYFSGHNNKVGFAWLKWKAEDGEADADIVRLQYQLAF